MTLRRQNRGFTLVEMLAAIMILALLALLSHRGLATVIDTRDHVQQETEKWQRVSAFVERFERDIMLAAPRPTRNATTSVPAWLGRTDAAAGSQIEFSRFASTENMDVARRLGYRLNTQGEVELWIWPTLDIAAGTEPARYPVLSGIARFEVQYLGATLNWEDSWPGPDSSSFLPKAVRLRLLLNSGEELIRIYAL